MLNKMSCLLCFSDSQEVEYYGITDCSETTTLTGVDLIRKNMSNIANKILTDKVLIDSDSSMCTACWSALENFNSFSMMVVRNYSKKRQTNQLQQNQQREQLTVDNFEIAEVPDEPENDMRSERCDNFIDLSSPVNKIEIKNEENNVVNVSEIVSQQFEEQLPTTSTNSVSNYFFNNRQIIRKKLPKKISKPFKSQIKNNSTKPSTNRFKDRIYLQKTKCPYPNCNTIYSNKYNMEAHVKAVHEQIKVKCPICEKQFKYRPGMNAHMRTAHPDGY